MSNELTTIAKNLRKKTTFAEKALWMHIRGKQLEGVKFRRQQSIGAYIVDFVCFEKKIVIELDGGQHAKQKAIDNIRDNWLFGEGFKVLRFWNNEVLQNFEAVLEVIRANLINYPPLTSPIKGGEK